MSIGIQDSTGVSVYDSFRESCHTETGYNTPAAHRQKDTSVCKNEIDNASKHLSAFKDTFTNIIKQTAEKIIDDYTLFCIDQRNIALSKERCAFEFLSIGIFWNNYSNASRISSKLVISAIQFLYKESESTNWLKAAIEPIRGVLCTLFLLPYVNNTTGGTPTFDYPSFVRLIEWLDAVGGYDEEIGYFSEWGRFINQKKAHDVEICLRKAVFVAQWFEIHSRNALGMVIPKTDPREYGTRSTGNDSDFNFFKSCKETEYFRKFVAVEP